MIHVIATLQLRPNTRERVLREIDAISAQVHAEDGCLEYCAAVDVQSGLAAQSPLLPDGVTVLERWKDIAALMAHLAAPHMQIFGSRVADLVVSASLQVLRPAELQYQPLSH